MMESDCTVVWGGISCVCVNECACVASVWKAHVSVQGVSMCAHKCGRCQCAEDMPECASCQCATWLLSREGAGMDLAGKRQPG